MTKCSPVSPDEVRKVIQQVATKSCGLDPILTYLLKQCFEPLLPLITAIINKSLADSRVPACFKEANVRPLVKKPGLDKERLKNYRPASNLPFLSKVLEKIVAKQIELHFSTHGLFDELQSASTETAFLSVHHDITEALDNKCKVALVLLDLSTAFDVIDHDILYKHLEYSYGLSDCVLAWMKSYLRERTQRVVIDKS